MERCVFCGWTRRTSFPSIRFFMIPMEPGMKRIMWLHAIDRKEIQPRDRVCSVHFRAGRPSNDPSHEDFAPHLYLNSEPPPEVLVYLEDLAEAKTTEQPPAPSTSKTDQAEYKAKLNPSNPTRIEVNKVARPSILRRKRKAVDEQQQNQPDFDNVGEISVVDVPRQSGMSYTLNEAPMDGYAMHTNSEPPRTIDPPPAQHRKVRVQLLHRSVAEAAGVRAGQAVIIRRKVMKKNVDELSVV